MAKIKFGMMMTDARGKLGGQVFSKNRAGAYVRTKVTPSNPRTITQQLSRAILGALSAGWSGLDEAQRRTWNNAVNDWQSTDVFGDLRKPTGKNLFTGLNKEILQSGGTQINVAPEKVEVPNITIVSAEAEIAASQFDIVTSGTTTGAKLQVWATPALTQGTSFIDDKLRVIGYINGGANVTLDIFDLYVDKFGALASGANVYVQVKVVMANGQAGVPVRAKADIAD